MHECSRYVEPSSLETQQETERRPHWDATGRQITFGAVVIKRYRQAAENQIAMLEAFEKNCWGSVIDNPLPDEGFVDRIDQLYETVKSLNRGHLVHCIVFFTCNCGSSVGWRMVPSTPEAPRGLLKFFGIMGLLTVE